MGGRSDALPPPRDILLTLQERRSRLTLARRLLSKDAEITASAIAAELGGLPARARRTLIVLYMIAFFRLFTFIAPCMHEVAGVGPDGLPMLLLIFGLFGTVGIFVGGRLTDLDPVRSLVFSYPVLAVCFAVTWLVTPSSWPMGTSAIAIVWAAGGIAAIATQNRVLAGARRAPELASTLMSSVFNVGIAIGAGLGAWLLARGMPIADMPAIGVVALTVPGVRIASSPNVPEWTALASLECSRGAKRSPGRCLI